MFFEPIDKNNRRHFNKLFHIDDMNKTAAEAWQEYSYYTLNNPSSFPKKQLDEFLNLDLNNIYQFKFYRDYFENRLIKLDVEDYQNDYYAVNIRPKPVTIGKYKLEYMRIKPYQVVPYDDIEIDKNYHEQSCMGYFTRAYEYLAITKDNVVWMSLDPVEINTMKTPIKEAKGNVIAFGLGLGYFPIMAAMKKEVNRVTVIECDPTIIRLFKENILPLCPYKEKISIIEDDAFHFIKDNPLVFEYYNFAFMDIWHSPEDGLPLFLKFEQLLAPFEIEKYYWLDVSLKAMLRRCFISLLQEVMNNESTALYYHPKTELDRIISEMFFMTKTLHVYSYNTIYRMLDMKRIIKMFKKPLNDK